MTELTQQRKELINRRDDLAEKHYKLGGAHADSGARNCDCEIAKEYREADRACDEFFAQKKASRSSLESENARLREALKESVKLQSHYAMLLNGWDGGKRIEFKSSDEWLERLAGDKRGNE